MAEYVYSCSECNEQFSIYASMKDKRDNVKCSLCGSENIHRVYNPTGVIFKGRGFYCTDYGKKAQE